MTGVDERTEGDLGAVNGEAIFWIYRAVPIEHGSDTENCLAV